MKWIKRLMRRSTDAGGGGSSDWLKVLLLLGWTEALIRRSPSRRVAGWGVLDGQTDRQVIDF